MSALAAIVFGMLGVSYAVWPALRMREVPLLRDEVPDGYSQSDAEAESGVLRRWSVAAGELEDTESPPAPGPAAEGDR